MPHLPDPTRRSLVLAGMTLAAAPLARASSEVAALLARGGCVVLLRHARTDPGIGDPPGFRLDDCGTQRNLSEAGRDDARRIGAWFQTERLTPRAVRSSAWCRCVDTARLAFGRHEVWPALNSFFGAREGADAQTRALRAALGRMPDGRFECWVTHQVNMTALTGDASMAMGEAFIVDRAGTIVSRTTFQPS